MLSGYLDEIFTALYGSDTDNETGTKWTDCYYWEAKGIESDIFSYIEMITDVPNVVFNKNDLAKFIVLSEYESIGNTHLVKEHLNIIKLEAVADELIKVRRVEHQEI